MENALQLHAVLPLLENDSRPAKGRRKLSVYLCNWYSSPSFTRSRALVFSSKAPGSNSSRGCSCTNCKTTHLIKEANLMLLCGFYICTSEILQILLPGVLWGVSKVLDQLWFSEAFSLFVASLT